MPGEQDLVLADDIPGPEAREADRARRAPAGLAEAPVHGMLGKRSAARAGGNLAEPKRRPGRRVGLAAVVGFEDLDVVVLRQGGRRTAHQFEQEVHGERHVGRDEHGLPLAERAEQPLPRCVEAR